MTETAKRGAARFGELARERHRLEQSAEDRTSALLETLGELGELDRVQRSLSRRADLGPFPWSHSLGFA